MKYSLRHPQRGLTENDSLQPLDCVLVLAHEDHVTRYKAHVLFSFSFFLQLTSVLLFEKQVFVALNSDDLYLTFVEPILSREIWVLIAHRLVSCSFRIWNNFIAVRIVSLSLTPALVFTDSRST